MSTQDDLQTLQTSLTDASNAATALETDLNSDTPDPNDTIVSSLVSALEAAGYTVTAPEAEIPASTGE